MITALSGSFTGQITRLKQLHNMCEIRNGNVSLAQAGLENVSTSEVSGSNAWIASTFSTTGNCAERGMSSGSACDTYLGVPPIAYSVQLE